MYKTIAIYIPCYSHYQFKELLLSKKFWYIDRNGIIKSLQSMKISDYNLCSRLKKEEMNKELEMDESLSAFVLLSFHC